MTTPWRFLGLLIFTQKTYDETSAHPKSYTGFVYTEDMENLLAVWYKRTKFEHLIT